MTSYLIFPTQIQCLKLGRFMEPIQLNNNHALYQIPTLSEGQGMSRAPQAFWKLSTMPGTATRDLYMSKSMVGRLAGRAFTTRMCLSTLAYSGIHFNIIKYKINQIVSKIQRNFWENRKLIGDFKESKIFKSPFN